MFGRGFKQSAFLGQGFDIGIDPLADIIPGGTDLDPQIQADTPRCYQCPDTPEPRMLVPGAATVCQEVDPSLCAEGAAPATDAPVADVPAEEEEVGGVPCPSCVCKVPGEEKRPCFDFNYQGTGECGVKTMDTSNCNAVACVEAIDPETGEPYWTHPNCSDAPGEQPTEQPPAEDLCPDGQPRNPDGTCESAYHADVCPDGSPMPVDGICPPEETCPEGQETIMGQCGTAAIACPNGDGTYRVFEIEEWNGRTGNNVPTGRVFAEAATQDQLREFKYDRIAYLEAEESECSGGASDEHFACLRVSGYQDLVNPETGEVLEAGIEEANLPPNTTALPAHGVVCNPCPAGMTAHEDGYGCCEPPVIVTNENGECVERRVCHHPGINNDYAETLPENMDWWETVGGYTPTPPNAIDTPVDASQCAVTTEPTECPAGEELDEFGVCVPIPSVCPEGEELDAAGVCQPIEVVCPEGEELDADGVCQPIEVVCPEGEEAQADGTCALIPCLAGEIRNDAGECVPADETEYQWCGDDEIGYTLFSVVNGEVTDIIAEDVPTPDTRAYLEAPITVPIGGDLCGAPVEECPAGEVLYDDGTCGSPDPAVTPGPNGSIPVDGGVPLPGGGGGAGPVPVGGGGSLPGGGGFPGGTPAGGVPTGGGIPTGGTPPGGVPTGQGTGFPTQKTGGAAPVPGANPFTPQFVPCGSQPPVNIRKLRTETVAARPDAFTEAWKRY